MAKEKTVVRGCIKTTRGPWKVQKTTKDGCLVTKLRYPTETERYNNRERERQRRAVTQKIFAGLRAHGNYKFAKYANTNDILITLCKEAGWIVGNDGTINGKMNSTTFSTSAAMEENQYCCCEFQQEEMP